MAQKFAIVTGASRGIGLAVAHYLASKNYNLILISRSSVNLIAAKHEIVHNYPDIDIHEYAFDISDVCKVAKFIKNITMGLKIDVLFNNAGVLHEGTVFIKTSDLQNLMNVNLIASYEIAKTVAEIMMKEKSGYIFNCASMSGVRALENLGGYAASKFGVIGYSQAMEKELSKYGVKVSAICPAVVNTDMTKNNTLKQKLPTDDIVLTIDYLLNISKYAKVSTISIENIDHVI